MNNPSCRHAREGGHPVPLDPRFRGDDGNGASNSVKAF
jgi:hypothetical protein